MQASTWEEMPSARSPQVEALMPSTHSPDLPALHHQALVLTPCTLAWLESSPPDVFIPLKRPSQYYFETIFPRIPKKVTDDIVDELKKRGLPTTAKGNAGQVSILVKG